MTILHDSLFLANATSLDERLKLVATYSDLPDPSVATNYLYNGATIYVQEENCNYYLGKIQGINIWIPLRQLFLRTTVIYSSDITSDAVGSNYFLKFNTALAESKMIGDNSLIIDSYNSDANTTIGAVNIILKKECIYLIKCHIKILCAQSEDLRLKIYLADDIGTVSNPIPGTTLVAGDSRVSGKSASGSPSQTIFSAEAIITTNDQNSVLSVALESLISNFSGISMTQTEIQSGLAYQSTLGELQIFKLKETAI